MDIGQAAKVGPALIYFLGARQGQAVLTIERLVSCACTGQPVGQLFFQGDQGFGARDGCIGKKTGSVGYLQIHRLQRPPADAGGQFQQAQVRQLLVQDSSGTGVKRIAIQFEAFEMNFFNALQLVELSTPVLLEGLDILKRAAGAPRCVFQHLVRIGKNDA